MMMLMMLMSCGTVGMDPFPLESVLADGVGWACW